MKRDEAITAAARLLLQGYQFSDVRAQIEQWRKKEGLRSPAGSILEAALDRFAELDELDPSAHRGLLLALTLDLAREMRRVGDFAGALRAVDINAKLAGIYGKRAKPPEAQKSEPTDAAGGDVADLLQLIRGTGSDR